MDLATHNQRIASALFRAGLLDEAALRRAIEEAKGQDLGALLVRTGRLRQEDLQRALSRPSGSLPALAPPTTGRPSGRVPAVGPTGTVVAATSRASGVHAVPSPPEAAAALDLTLRTAAPADLDLTIRTGAPGPARDLDLTVQTAPPGPGTGSGSRPSGRLSGSGLGGSTGLGSGAGTSSFLAGALAVGPGEDVPPGTQLGNYVVQRLIAKGGMGAVFVAEHALTKRAVALKVLLAGEGATEEQLQRFLVEARTSSKLSHPNVVPVYEVGEAAGVHFMTMELVDGPSLRQLIRDAGTLAPRRALHLVEQVARGVAAAHAEKIVHRDLKPHNVLVAKGDVAKVMDFGLAKESDHAGKGLTVSGALLGTPSYMAPEQAAGEKVGPLADVYGLGAILYECLTGKPPFEGPTLANIITKVLSQDIVPPRQKKPTIHPDVETICLKALEKEPRKRYPSAKALAEDMARWLAGEAIQARPITGPERARRWARRHVPHVVGGAILVPVLVFLGVWFLAIAPRKQQESDARAAALERKRLEDERRAKVDAEVQAFRATYERQRRTIDAAAAAAVDLAVTALRDPRERDAFEDRLAQALEVVLPEAAGVIAAERAKLGAEARAAIAQDAALGAIDLSAATAGVWRSIAGAYGKEPPSAARDERLVEANAFTYAAAPTTPEGLRGIARILLERESAGADAVIDDLLNLADPLPQDLEVALRTRRAKRRLSRFELRPAAQDVRRVEELGAAQEVADLKAFLWPFLSAVTVTIDRPGAEGPATQITGLRPLLGGPGERARLEVTFADGAAAVCELAAGSSRAKVVSLVAPARFERAPDEWIQLSAFRPSSERPLAAFFVQPARRLVLTDGDGNRLWSNQHVADQVTLLQFMDLDDDPRTAHLVLVMGPNQGDSVVVRVSADGRISHEDLDPQGRHSRKMKGAQCYIDGAVCVPTAAGPRLVLAYGAWGSNCFRVLREEQGRLVPCGPDLEVGHIQAMQYVPAPDGKPWLIVAHQENEEGYEEGWTERGVAVYGFEGDRIVRRPVAQLKRPAPEVANYETGYRDLVFFRTSKVAYAVMNHITHYRSGRGGRIRDGRFFVARLDPGAERLIAEEQLSEHWAGARTTGDFLGEGQDQLVLVAKGLELRVLGSRGAKVEVPPEGPRTITPAQAEARAIGHLDALGFQGPVLARLRAREAEVGPTRETELVGLAVLADAERKRGYEAADRVFAPDADFEALSLAFATAANRTPDARARAHVLRARHHLRAGTAEGAKRADAELVQVPPAQELAGDALDAQVLADELMCLRLHRRAAPLEVDFRQPRALTGFVATNPVRTRLVEGRGIVARFNRRDALVAGVPVVIPAGPVRLTMEYEIDGTTWQAMFDVGLLRAADGDLEAGDDLECLAQHGTAWLATSDLRRATHETTPGFGAPAATLRRPTDRLAFTPVLGFPLTTRAALRVTLEHDPRTRWSHVRVVETTTDTVLYDRDGVSDRALAPGQYLAGLRTNKTRVADFIGQNFPPDACLTLKRMTIEANDRAWLLPDRRELPQGAAGGAALRAEALGGEGAAEALGELGRYADASPPPRRAKLRLARADVRVRLGDARGAREDVEAAWAVGPFAFFRAVEDLDLRLQPETKAHVRELLRRERLALDRELAQRPSDRSLWEKSAVVLRLRGEDDECLAALDRAEALPGAADTRPLRLWLRSPIQSDEAMLSALSAAWPASDHPERDELLTSFWSPLEEGVDGAAAAAAEVERLLASGRVDVRALDEWLVRSVELAPGSAKAWTQRARVTSALLRQNIRLSHFFYRLLADMRRASELAPDDAQLAAETASWELNALDPLGAGERLRALRRRGDIRQLVDQLAPRAGDDAPAFRQAVLGSDAEWDAYRKRLVVESVWTDAERRAAAGSR